MVTSVPSDSPDDFAALRDLQNKAVSHLALLIKSSELIKNMLDHCYLSI